MHAQSVKQTLKQNEQVKGVRVETTTVYRHKTLSSCTCLLLTALHTAALVYACLPCICDFTTKATFGNVWSDPCLKLGASFNTYSQWTELLHTWPAKNTTWSNTAFG